MKTSILIAALLGLLFWPTPARADFAFINQATGTAQSGSEHTASTSAVNMTGADTLVLIVAQSEASPDPVITDNVGANAWTKIARFNSAVQYGPATIVYVAASARVSSSMTVTGTHGSFSAISLVLLGFSGGSSSPADVNAGNTGTYLTSIQAGSSSLTPSQNNSLVVAALGAGDNQTAAINSGYSSVYEAGGIHFQNYRVAAAYSIQTTATATNPTFSWSSSDFPTTLLVSLKPATGGSSWLTNATGQHIYNGNSGNVGIGVGLQSPLDRLSVSGRVSSFFDAVSYPNMRGFIAHNGNAGGLTLTSQGVNNATAGSGDIRFVTSTANSANGSTDAPTAERVRIRFNGNVGIGTSAPSTKLHVVGDVTVEGNIAAKYQDLAEWVHAATNIPAGTVVILDTARRNAVIPSNEAYDTKVAGVVSAIPGIVLGEAGEGKIKVATTGRVLVRVDATRTPIRTGDLLVTSDREGTAMRSEPADLGGAKLHRPGTLIGKALEPIADGQGEILVLLSLQ
jgi:hypothetical protein